MLMWSVLVASFVMLVLMFFGNLYLSDRQAHSSGSSGFLPACLSI